MALEIPDPICGNLDSHQSFPLSFRSCNPALSGDTSTSLFAPPLSVRVDPSSLHISVAPDTASKSSLDHVEILSLSSLTPQMTAIKFVKTI